MTKASDSAILNLGDIGEQNTFTSTTGPGNTTSTVHSFEDKIPDSALDPDLDSALDPDLHSARGPVLDYQLYIQFYK